MTEPLQRPKRKNPLRKTRAPLLPLGSRSRTALGLTAAAAEGRFAEAVHLLLYRSLEEIDAKRPHTLKPALTSRDIVSLKALPAAASRALGRLVATVERSFFGGRRVDARDFSEMRLAYEEFAFSETWAGKTS